MFFFFLKFQVPGRCWLTSNQTSHLSDLEHGFLVRPFPSVPRCLIVEWRSDRGLPAPAFLLHLHSLSEEPGGCWPARDSHAPADGSFDASRSFVLVEGLCLSFVQRHFLLLFVHKHRSDGSHQPGSLLQNCSTSWKTVGKWSVGFIVVTSTSVWVFIFGSTTIPNIVLTNQNSISGVDDFCMSLKGPAGQWFHSFVVLLDVGWSAFWFHSATSASPWGSCRPSGSLGATTAKEWGRQVFSVLFVFLLCFVHFHIVRISFMKNEVTGQYNCSGLWVKILHDSCLWMSTTNICLDPLLYVCLWREYRNQLLDLKNRWISLIRVGWEWSDLEKLQRK